MSKTLKISGAIILFLAVLFSVGFNVRMVFLNYKANLQGLGAQTVLAQIALTAKEKSFEYTINLSQDSLKPDNVKVICNLNQAK